MQTIRTSGTTDPDGRLTLSVPVGQPNAEFEAIVVLQPNTTASGARNTKPDPWPAINAFRERLAASGRSFTDSAELIREDRER